ncbi:MAG: TIGR03751 family conjugal transfer lipoprotein [Bacteroidetes bacterium]|nr:MAG: TIGR03751 family conjugal transfer lipoprotein [Bacteroidota bacterium]
MHSRLRPIVTIAWISLALGGCASTKESVLPQDGPSMKAIYDAHFEGMGADDPYVLRRELGTRPLGDDDVDLAGYSRTAHTELETIFPRLPNPTLVMYVFPHLAGSERVPVPGYATTFTLYERVEYALPGEVPSGQR